MSTESEKKARLASALRANLARRKAQGRARAAQDDDAPIPDGERLTDGEQDEAQNEAAASEASQARTARIVHGDGEG